MKAKEFIPQSKPRNFVAKNAKTGGAGQHRDKKKEQKQGYEKHKGQGVAEGSGSNTATLDAVFNEPDFDRLEHIWPALEAGDKKEALRQINHYLNRGKNRAWWGDLQALDIEIDQNDVENSLVMWSKPVNKDMEEAGKYGSGGYALDSDDAVYGYRGRNRNRERDWDEGNTEPPNNFAVYINGKKWKVFQGRGTYADDAREMAQYYKLQDWARKKSQETGKKWEVSRTGEPATA